MPVKSSWWLVFGAAAVVMCGCSDRPGTPSSADTTGAVEEAPIPDKLDIPADFTPQPDDFVEGGKGGMFMGIRKLRGRSLSPRSGVHPIHVVSVIGGMFEGDPIAVGDLVIGVNGKPLHESPVYQFKMAVGRTRKDTGIVSVTRWRNGAIDTFDLDLNVKIPDLTKGGKPNDFHDWLLGPTGLNGWVHCVGIDKGGSADARQILVTRVEPGSPADGKVLLEDVILGVNGTKFTTDARRALAAAINEAEREENAGWLKLKIWRAGEELDIELKLETLSELSNTTPYDCRKANAIVDKACSVLKDRQLGKNWAGWITALGMLSTGRQDLMPKLKQFAHDSCVPGEVLNIETHQSMMCWTWSWKCLYLCEYYLLTGDRYVLPTIKEYATKIAMGQSGVGTWGHTVAARENTGSLHGHLGGYGALNQVGLPMLMCLPLAVKCGISNDEITTAIRKGDIFFSYYTDKGAVPYGDHAPGKGWYDDNGKSAATAVAFDLLGNRRGAEFFGAMALGSAPSGREAGHTGCFWSHLWGGLGSLRAGEKSMQAFMKEMNWAFTLERHTSGSIVYQGNVGEAGKKGEDKTRGSFDSTGARLLQLCAPRKVLYITGKENKTANPLGQERIEEVLSAGRLWSDLKARKQLSRDRIMELLGDPLPATRATGARALLDQRVRCVDDLVAMLDSPNRHARYGACDALRESGYGSVKAVKRLVEIIETSDDLMLRLNAMDALTGTDPETSLATSSKSAIPALLKLAVMKYDIDPRRLLQRQLGYALFNRHGLITLHGRDGVESSLLVPAVRELLTVDDGNSRGLTASVYKMLTDAERKQLWNDIHLATRDTSPSGIMFADSPRLKGLQLMQEQGVAEGVDLTIAYMSEKRWGQGRRERDVLPIFAAYGPAAKKALPLLLELKERWTSSKRKASEEDLAHLEKAITSVQSGESKQLRSIAEYLLQDTK